MTAKAHPRHGLLIGLRIAIITTGSASAPIAAEVHTGAKCRTRIDPEKQDLLVSSLTRYNVAVPEESGK